MSELNSHVLRFGELERRSKQPSAGSRQRKPSPRGGSGDSHSAGTPSVVMTELRAGQGNSRKRPWAHIAHGTSPSFKVLIRLEVSEEECLGGPYGGSDSSGGPHHPSPLTLRSPWGLAAGSRGEEGVLLGCGLALAGAASPWGPSSWLRGHEAAGTTLGSR